MSWVNRGGAAAVKPLLIGKRQALGDFVRAHTQICLEHSLSFSPPSPPPLSISLPLSLSVIGVFVCLLLLYRKIQGVVFLLRTQRKQIALPL